jgi:hypothetical protein
MFRQKGKKTELLEWTELRADQSDNNYTTKVPWFKHSPLNLFKVRSRDSSLCRGMTVLDLDMPIP